MNHGQEMFSSIEEILEVVLNVSFLLMISRISAKGSSRFKIFGEDTFTEKVLNGE